MLCEPYTSLFPAKTNQNYPKCNMKLGKKWRWRWRRKKKSNEKRALKFSRVILILCDWFGMLCMCTTPSCQYLSMFYFFSSSSSSTSSRLSIFLFHRSLFFLTTYIFIWRSISSIRITYKSIIKWYLERHALV